MATSHRPSSNSFSSSPTKSNTNQTNFNEAAPTMSGIGPHLLGLISSYLDQTSDAFLLSYITSAKEIGLVCKDDFKIFTTLFALKSAETQDMYELAIYHCLQQVKYLKQGYKWSLASCTHCKKLETATDDPFLICGGCGVHKYCCRACCVADWHHHRKLCSLFESNKRLWADPSTVGGIGVASAARKWRDSSINKSLSTSTPNSVNAPSMPPPPLNDVVLSGESDDDSSQLEPID